MCVNDWNFDGVKETEVVVKAKAGQGEARGVNLGSVDKVLCELYTVPSGESWS